MKFVQINFKITWFLSLKKNNGFVNNLSNQQFQPVKILFSCCKFDQQNIENF